MIKRNYLGTPSTRVNRKQAETRKTHLNRISVSRLTLTAARSQRAHYYFAAAYSLGCKLPCCSLSGVFFLKKKLLFISSHKNRSGVGARVQAPRGPK